jgi:hypothetical protein
MENLTYFGRTYRIAIHGIWVYGIVCRTQFAPLDKAIPLRGIPNDPCFAALLDAVSG